MKKKLAKFLILSLLMCNITSCERDEIDDENDIEEPNKNNVSSDLFSAKVDGKDFPKAVVENTKVKFVKSMKTLQLLGQPEGHTETINVTLANNVFNLDRVTAKDWKPGVYDDDADRISAGKYGIAAEYNKWNGSEYEAWFSNSSFEKGTQIIIESNDGVNIKGTFKFKAFRRINGNYDRNNSKTITEGKFNVKIVEI